MELIEENVINYNIANSQGHTPLSLAASKGMSTIVELLIENGASILEAELIGKSPKQEAMINDDIQLAKLLDRLKAQSSPLLNRNYNKKTIHSNNNGGGGIDSKVSSHYVAQIDGGDEFYFDAEDAERYGR